VALPDTKSGLTSEPRFDKLFPERRQAVGLASECQLVSRRASKQVVAGSSPVSRSTNLVLSSNLYNVLVRTMRGGKSRFPLSMSSAFLTVLHAKWVFVQL